MLQPTDNNYINKKTNQTTKYTRDSLIYNCDAVGERKKKEGEEEREENKDVAIIKIIT